MRCEASGTLHNLAASRLSLHSPTHSVLARIEGHEPLDSALNSSAHDSSAAVSPRVQRAELSSGASGSRPEFSVLNSQHEASTAMRARSDGSLSGAQALSWSSVDASSAHKASARLCSTAGSIACEGRGVVADASNLRAPSCAGAAPPASAVVARWSLIDRIAARLIGSACASRACAASGRDSCRRRSS